MTTAALFPHQEPLHKILYELLCILHGLKRDANEREAIKKLLTQLADLYDRKISDIEIITESCRFENEWATLVWGLLTVVCKLKERSNDCDQDEVQLEERLNLHLVSLVNLWRTAQPFEGLNENEFQQWQHFYGFLTQTLHSLHDLYSHGESPRPDEDLKIFRDNELRMCIESFKSTSRTYIESIASNLRYAQIERISTFTPIKQKLIDDKAKFYSKVIYCMGIICARLQGFRYWALSSPDPIKPLMDYVVTVVEQLLSDCLFCCEPSTSAILVTNNLFSFQSGCLARGILFQQFEIQIVSEETAYTVQSDMNNWIVSGRRPTVAQMGRAFPSAALLAMKPTTGTKRNNATANAEGGNTAHKKSDVNSKESVVLAPSFNEKYRTWQVSYPHLLCTTRQKDSALLDARSNQIGKRPLFYFFIKGTLFSPSGGSSYCYTLSLPFTIATRRNQDCQVQRMMSSYTATCFWLYGTSTLEGLLLVWSEKGIGWNRFKDLYKAHFKFNAEVNRDLADDDFDLLEQKMKCEDCSLFANIDPSTSSLLTFKNVLCPHLRYDSADNSSCKFSVWRGILEILQIFQDAKTNAKQLWDDGYLLGFLDNERVNRLMMQQGSSVLCLFLSYVVGGSVCIVVRPSSGELIHLEPLDLKKLQTKSLNDYLADIAAAENIDYLITAGNGLVPISDLVQKYRIGADSCALKEINSNITHSGSVDMLSTVRFTPMRIAVVTCRDKPDSSMEGSINQTLDQLTGNGYMQHVPPLTPITPTSMCGQMDQLHHAPPDFMSQLQHLMKMHNKDPMEVMNLLNYMNYGPPDPYSMLPPMNSMQMNSMQMQGGGYEHTHMN